MRFVLPLGPILDERSPVNYTAFELLAPERLALCEASDCAPRTAVPRDVFRLLGLKPNA